MENGKHHLLEEQLKVMRLAVQNVVTTGTKPNKVNHKNTKAYTVI